LCGALTAELDGRRIEQSLPGLKGYLMFACVVNGRHRPISSDELIDAIWHENRPAHPDGALSTSLTRVRGAIGPSRGELMLDVGRQPWIDYEAAREGVATAEAMLAGGNRKRTLAIAAEALDITRRPLRPGLSTPRVERRRCEPSETRNAEAVRVYDNVRRISDGLRLSPGPSRRAVASSRGPSVRARRGDRHG
jgi:hypothetical protein